MTQSMLERPNVKFDHGNKLCVVGKIRNTKSYFVQNVVHNVVL